MVLVLALLTVALGAASSADWLREAKYGAFMHLLPSDAKTLAMVDDFDVERLAGQLESIGAKYFVLTLGQNSGYFNAPNAVYDRTTGYRAGERCSKRDLPADLWRALHARGIRLMLYLPCQAPNEDRRAQKAFGLPQGKKDQPIDPAFAQQWASVIQDGRTATATASRAGGSTAATTGSSSTNPSRRSTPRPSGTATRTRL